MRKLLSLLLIAWVLTFPACELTTDPESDKKTIVSGRVRNVSENKPVAGARVYVVGGRGADRGPQGDFVLIDSTRADGDGNYRIEFRARRSLEWYVVNMSSMPPGYVKKTGGGDLDRDVTNEEDFEALVVQTFPLQVHVITNERSMQVGGRNDYFGFPLSSFSLSKTTVDTVVQVSTIYKTAPVIGFRIIAPGNPYGTKQLQTVFINDNTMLYVEVPDPNNWWR